MQPITSERLTRYLVDRMPHWRNVAVSDLHRLPLGASRALDWINYDEQRLSTAWATDSQPSQMLTCPLLRQYWMHYDGGTRLRASAARALMRGWTFEISGENLLNHQVGEPDNVTIVPGRTLMTGLRLRF